MRVGGRLMDNTYTRPWQVLLLGGASGTGKTGLSYRLARELGIGITEVDDFQVVLERMTTPEQQPALHFWRTHPDPGSLSAEEINEQGLDILEIMLPALEAVVENHLEAATPLVLEGDFIHPALAARDAFGDEPNAGRVRGVFLYEPDEGQIVQNFLEREPATGPQTTRARVSLLRAAWIRETCRELGIAALPARPWDTLFDRVLDAVQ
jgi:2-phosphoglycerate kinase